MKTFKDMCEDALKAIAAVKDPRDFYEPWQTKDAVKALALVKDCSKYFWTHEVSEEEKALYYKVVED